jgi:carboxyl-terminal processing protease
LVGLRYGFIDKSILVVTEGFGPPKFHGRVVVLVNEHTASAGEMVAAFAEENQLATIVGTKTPGRLLSGSAFKAGFGYIVGLPVAAYLTWEGRLIEGKGVSPNIPVGLSPEQLLAGESIGTCARALTQVATQAVITQAIPCVPSRWIQAKSVRCPARGS